MVLCTAGLSSFLFSSTTAAATAAGTGVTYKCRIDASYTVLDDDLEHPLIPTSIERIWAAETVKSTYNSVHSRFHTTDYPYAMSSVQYVGLTLTPAAAADEEWDEDVTSHGNSPRRLRRRETGSVDTVEDSSSKHDIPFPNRRRYSYHLTTTLSDTLSGVVWDDNGSLDIVPLLVDLEEEDVSLEGGGTLVHDQWVATWCLALQQQQQQGHHHQDRGFQDATACAIAMSDCTMMKKKVVEANNETTAVVEGTTEQILTEA